MVNVASDEPTLAAVVAGGPVHWRLNFQRVFRGYPVDEAIADTVFRFFCDQFLKRVGPGVSAAAFLDAIEPITPPTQKEIDEAWEIDSASSEAGRRAFYGPGGHPQEWLDRHVRES